MDYVGDGSAKDKYYTVHSPPRSVSLKRRMTLNTKNIKTPVQAIRNLTRRPIAINGGKNNQSFQNQQAATNGKLRAVVRI